MNCPSCGKEIKPGNYTCQNCGIALSNMQPPVSSPVENKTIVPQTTFDSFNKPITPDAVYTSTMQAMTSNTYSDDDLLTSYIGPNYNGITNGKFSWCTLLFGVLYTLYRKMWLLSIVWIVINAIAGIMFGKLATLVGLVINIIIGTMFKELYLKKANQKINRIKANNPTATPEELAKKCKRAGGTSLAPYVLIALSLVLYGVWIYLSQVK